MRKLLVSALMGGAIVWMFQNPDKLRSYTSGELARASKFFASLAGDESMKNAGTPPETKYSSLPEGVYSLTQPVRFNCGANGSALAPAGTLVKKRADGANGKMLVSNGDGTAVVEETYLTRDDAVIARMKTASSPPATSGTAPPPTAAAAQVRPEIANQLREVDAKLASLRQELVQIQACDRAAQLSGQKIAMATSEDFVRTTIASFEQKRAQILAQLPPDQRAQYPSR